MSEKCANLGLAKELAGITDPQPNACWPNSVEAMLAYRLTFKKKEMREVNYVEGWLLICKGKYAIAHGWLEIAGAIVDVTALGDYAPEDYYPAHAYSYEQFFTLLDPEEGLPLFNYYHAARKKLMEVFQALPARDKETSLALAQLDNPSEIVRRLREANRDR